MLGCTQSTAYSWGLQHARAWWEATLLLTPNRLQKRPRIQDLHNKPDEVEARLDILLLTCIANVAFHDDQAPPNAHSTPTDGSYPITYMSQAFTEESVQEVQTIRANDSSKMSAEEMTRCFIEEGGPEKANQLMKKHEWFKRRTRHSKEEQYRFVGQKFKTKGKQAWKSQNNEATANKICSMNNIKNNG